MALHEYVLKHIRKSDTNKMNWNFNENKKKCTLKMIVKCAQDWSGKEKNHIPKIDWMPNFL